MSKAITIAEIESRQATLIERGKAVRILLDGAESKRAQRASTVAVVKAVESKSTGAITATVESATSDAVYNVVIDGPVRGRVRRMSCTCRDHQDRGTVCKHIIAVGERFIGARRDEYRLLKAMKVMFA